MAALICIKIVRGTFCQLVNIANRFLRIFSNLETSIRFIFPGGTGYPYLPTRLDTMTWYLLLCHTISKIILVIYSFTVYSYDSDCPKQGTFAGQPAVHHDCLRSDRKS